MMRKKIVLFVITLFSGIAYLILDGHLFYYGKNDLDFYHKLPFGIIIDDRPDFEGGLMVKDKYGFTIAAKGNTYKFNDKIVYINNVLGYCYNTERVIAKIVDKKNKKYYIEFFGNTDEKKIKI